MYGDKHSVHRIRSVATDRSGHMAVLENGGRVKIFDISEMHAKPPSEKGEDEVYTCISQFPLNPFSQNWKCPRFDVLPKIQPNNVT